MLNYYYKDSIKSFLTKNDNEILGEIDSASQFDNLINQKTAWQSQITILKKVLTQFEGTLFFEFTIPRMGKRVDSIIIVRGTIFIIEFKVGQSRYLLSDIEQVWDYALDLKNFHEPSHRAILIPILVATEAKESSIEFYKTIHNDNVYRPIKSNKNDISSIIEHFSNFTSQSNIIDPDQYAHGRYSPTPTIIEAALSLYKNHTVNNITRNDAEAKNLSKTTSLISTIISNAKSDHKKIICFVTGVPGAGKTLVGLNIATNHLEETKGNASVYLSGNGPLVTILQEALTRDKINYSKINGKKLKKKEVKSEVKAFLQNVHHYRDAYITDTNPPYDHVAIFDEAQRAWTQDKTEDFTRRRKGIHNFKHSEPEFLISCLDRHKDWAVIICLVGGGQEINTGEAGIVEWLNAIKNKFINWQVAISPNLSSSEYSASEAISELQSISSVNLYDDLHLAVSMRSFRAETLSSLVKNILDRNINEAQNHYSKIASKYPIVLTRKLSKAKKWLREMARGSERYGLIVSSQAQRLKPYAIDVKSPINPIHWFLNDKDDIRSSFYLEDVATEFHIQGLELDWACITWDGDLRYSKNGWATYSFVGSRWNQIKKEERKLYLINAYRVLLTRARQGMIIVIPEGNQDDPTRKSEYYDTTFEYLKRIGLKMI